MTPRAFISEQWSLGPCGGKPMRTDPDLMNPPPAVSARVDTRDGAMSSSDLEALSLSLRASITTRAESTRHHSRLSQLGPDAKFHLRMALLVGLMLSISVVGCRLASIHVQIDGRVIALLAVFAMVAPLPLYWHEKGRAILRESTLVLPWELIVIAAVPFPVLIAARCGMPLQDALLGRIDQSLGVSVPSIMVWASHHWLGTLINGTYPQVMPFLVVAALLPPIVGKTRAAREFLLANLIAFAIGLPLFALIPAVAPWYYYHLVPPLDQAICWDMLRELRLPGPYVFHGQAVGLVCFPSFHVIWAILCAAALWGFRPIRIPVALLTLLIILSTLTTGWHYFVDVIAGVVIAVLAMAVARVYAM
jgi:membrane-associated phospholipid phosphatase